MPAPNLLAVEAQILGRLRTEITTPGLIIASAANLVGRDNLAAYCPGIFIEPGSSERSDDAEELGMALEQQLWTAVVLVKHTPNAGDGLQENFAAAGTLMGQVYAALAGWTPAVNSIGKFIYAGRQEPVAQRGWVEFAVDFTVAVGLAAN